MKKVLFTAMAAVAMFALVACNTKKAEEPVDTTACEAVEACEHHCMHEGDSAMCCKAEAAAVEGQACEKACEHKCDKAEGKECCKKAEGTDCCKKAEGKECEKKCEKKCEKAQ